MLIKYEKEVTDCHNGSIENKCALYQISSLDKEWRCCIDGRRFDSTYGWFPSQQRPCPLWQKNEIDLFQDLINDFHKTTDSEKKSKAKQILIDLGICDEKGLKEMYCESD